MTAEQRRHARLVFLALLFEGVTEEEAEKAVREFEKKEGISHEKRSERESGKNFKGFYLCVH
jgi:hypothetical protein